MSEHNEKKSEDGLADIATRQPQRPILMIAVITLAVFIIGFTFWHSQKTEKINPEHTAEEEYVITSSPAASNKSASPPIPSLSPEQSQQQAAQAAAIQVELQRRLAAPLLIVNNPVSQTSQGAVQASSVVQATALGNLSKTIAEGTFIHAVLETAIQSDLPGYIRAITTEPVYSEDGRNVLIPAGSRLVGQYQSGLSQGQTRLFAMWTKILTPSGMSLSIGSPSVDNLGQTGIGADQTNTHFWQRFGTATLLSILSAGASGIDDIKSTPNLSPSLLSSQTYGQAVADNLAQSSNDTLKASLTISPTIRVNQGKPMIVFVNKTILF